MSDDWVPAICTRYRVLVALGLIGLIWAASALLIFYREDRWLSRFDSLKVGMTRAELVKAVGEPPQMTPMNTPPEMVATKIDESVIGYAYELTTFGSRSSWYIGGIYLDDKEQKIVFLHIVRGIWERSDYFWPSLTVLAGYGALGVLLFLGLTRWCAKRLGLKQRGV